MKEQIEQRRDLTWTSNGRIWLALYGDQWAKIQQVETAQYPFIVCVAGKCQMTVNWILIQVSGPLLQSSKCLNMLRHGLKRSWGWSNEPN